MSGSAVEYTGNEARVPAFVISRPRTLHKICAFEQGLLYQIDRSVNRRQL